MGGLSTPRRTLMAGFPEIHRMGYGRVFGVVSVPDVRELAAGSRLDRADRWRAFIVAVRNGEFDLDESGRMP
jgi:hypothetical protein